MTRWSFKLTDTVTRTVLAQHVPMTGVSFSDGLMDAGGSFTGSFDVSRREFSEWISSDQLRRVIWPCRDGVPQGAYLFSQVPSTDASATKQQIRGERLDWLFGFRAITKTLTFNGVDQNRIIRDLFRFGMGRRTVHASPNQRREDNVLAAAQIPWITLDENLSGVTRVRQETAGNADDGYPGSSRKIVAQMVKNLTALRDASGTRGIEYRWLYRMSADGLPEMVLDTAGPSFTVGRPESAAHMLTLEYPGGRNGAVDSAAYGSDGTSIVTCGHVIGQKQDTDTPVGMAVYDDLHAQGYPLMDKVSSASEVQDAGVLAAKAAGLLWAADDAWAVKLRGGGNPQWGSIGLGDWVVLRVGGKGRTPKRRSMRVTGWSVEVDDSGRSEKVTPTVQVGKWF